MTTLDNNTNLIEKLEKLVMELAIKNTLLEKRMEFLEKNVENLEKHKALTSCIDLYKHDNDILNEVILDNNLIITTGLFWKELLREEGFTIGRLDSRYKGVDSKDGGTYPEYPQELSSWDHAFTPAMNSYIREILNFKTDIKYNTWARDELSVRPWNTDNVNIRRRFREAIAENPFLNVLIQSGYYDGATTFSAAKYTIQQVDPSGKLKERFTFKGYESGHMMYLRREDLQKSNQDLRDFIKKTVTNNLPAKY